MSRFQSHASTQKMRIPFFFCLKFLIFEIRINIKALLPLSHLFWCNYYFYVDDFVFARDCLNWYSYFNQQLFSQSFFFWWFLLSQCLLHIFVLYISKINFKNKKKLSWKKSLSFSFKGVHRLCFLNVFRYGVPSFRRSKRKSTITVSFSYSTTKHRTWHGWQVNFAVGNKLL